MLFNKMESNGLSVTFSRNVLFAVIHSGIIIVFSDKS